MALTESYLITTKRLKEFLNDLVTTRPPERFNNKFLESLGYPFTNDRLFIGMLKALGFLDQNGVPKERYYKFIDPAISKQVLANGIREAYEDLFAVNTKAYSMSKTEVKNKLKTLFQGNKSEKVLQLMSATFKGLCDYADFSNKSLVTKPREEDFEVLDENEGFNEQNNLEIGEIIKKTINTEMHYNIQIHLPETKDMAVYDAIFKSLKKHLL